MMGKIKSINDKRHMKVKKVKVPWGTIVLCVLFGVVIYLGYNYWAAKSEEEPSQVVQKMSPRSVVPLSVKKLESLGKMRINTSNGESVQWCKVAKNGDSLTLEAVNRSLFIQYLNYNQIDAELCGVYKSQTFAGALVLRVPISNGLAQMPAISAISLWNLITHQEQQSNEDSNN